MRLDMANLGMVTLNRQMELSSRERVAKSSRFDKGFVDKNLAGNTDSVDPWKIRTYASSVKKRQAVQKNEDDDQDGKPQKKLFVTGAK